MVQVLRSVYDAMVAHALTTPTLECCGLLSGRNGTITRLFQTPNVAENKAVRYEAAPLDVRRILEETDIPIKRIAAECGFGQEERLRRAFARQVGTTPAEYRARF